jgi:hypothetical protein
MIVNMMNTVSDSEFVKTSSKKERVSENSLPIWTEITQKRMNARMNIKTFI